MGAIHELREEYRYYRGNNPGYRWLFLLVDLASFLIKLALFGGFLFLCWYLLSRSPYADQADLIGKKAATPAAEEVVSESAPELTEERLARLRDIAGQDSSTNATQGGLVGNVTAAPDAVRDLSSTAIPTEKPTISEGTFIVATFGDQSVEPAVQVESIAVVSDQSSADVSPVLIDDQSDNQKDRQVDTQTDALFTDNVYIAEDTEDGAWILDQNSGNYTIQLALTVNVEFLVDFARELPDEYTAAIYPERVNGSGNIQYSLSLGSFPSKRGAEAAMAELDENLKRYGAHTRVFDEVQSNISEFVL